MKTIEQLVALVFAEIKLIDYVCDLCSEQGNSNRYWIDDKELGSISVCQRCYNEAGNLSKDQEAELDKQLEDHLRNN